MAIIATDLIIKSMLEAALADYRANHWVLEDVFAGLADDPMAAPESGWKEVKAAIDWFLKTDIPVVTQHRIADAPKIPCISIAYKPSREMQERASLADDGIIEDYDVSKPGRGTTAIIKITNNFTPDAYDRMTGEITMPKGFNTDLMSVGNYLIAKNGNAYQIKSIAGGDKFSIEPNIADDFTDCYVSPKTSIWNAHRELTFIEESYSIGCHTQNDPATTIWLWQLVFYAFLRYKEAFLEGRGYELSSLSSSELMRNPEFQAENVFSKYIDISGQTQACWIKFIAPKFESVKGHIKIADSTGAVDIDYTYGEDSEDCPPAWSTGDDFDESDEVPMLGDDDEDC